MFGSILHRMILWELIKVFVMSLVGITGILLMAGIVAEASQQGLAPTQILAAIPLLIPSTLPYTIPATTLFACCVVYGRLSADNEILAIKSCGVNILHVVRPGLLLGLIMSGVTMALYHTVIPSSHLLLRQMIYNDAEELLYSMLRKQHSINYTQMPYAMWVKGVEGRKLIDPVIKGRNAQNQTNFVAQAREAELRVDMAHRKLSIRMRFGTATTLDGDKDITFEAKEVEIDLPPSFGANGPHHARDMTWDELAAKRRALEARVADLKERIKGATNDPSAALEADPPPPDLADDEAPTEGPPKSLKRLQVEEQYCRLQIVWLDVEMLMRLALSVGCFCFILVGCPVGIWFSRNDYLSAFIICFLPIVIVYYPLLLCGTGIAKEGHYNAALLVWGPNLFMGALGAILFWRLLRN